MSLQLLSYIDLPAHVGEGTFDHAAVSEASGRLYVAHTANSALDVIDCANDTYLHSIPDLAGVAGVLVSDARKLIFTSNREEDTIGIISPEPGSESKNEKIITKIKSGIRPNGLAHDSSRNLLLVAHAGNPEDPHSYTVAIIDVGQRHLIGEVAVPGRTRWAVFDPWSDAFYVNIIEPAAIVVISPRSPRQVVHTLPVPTFGPHGLDIDLRRGRLFCACDSKRVLVLDTGGSVQQSVDISGEPDAIFFNADRRRLYVACGDPGLIDVIETMSMRVIATVETERGAHTIGFDAARHKVYAFLPESHRAAVYSDQT